MEMEPWMKMAGQQGNSSRCADDDDDDTQESSSSSDDEMDGTCKETVRKKRHLPHGVFAYALKSTRLQERGTNFDPNPIYGNPKYNNIMMLHCRTGWHLKLDPGGKVSGDREDTNPNVIFEISSAGQDGHVFLKCVHNNLYVAFNKKGRLYGEIRKGKEGTVWLEEFLGSYNTYMSRSYAHRGWYLAIKKSGKPKRGDKTGWGQKAIQFLPRRV
ncbi:fibroblast growth factor 1-like [Arctopsyche grandis]|uniref:fibroblast growth factor 1-like n=1 Tax=Arctopsyche grandis TaxID=121162 RepID=UPI00406D70DE